MRILRFLESSELKNFENTFVYELPSMSANEVIDLISNTFPSKVISSDPEWTIIESDWNHIDNDGNRFTSLMNKELIGKTYKVYFHLLQSDYVILRGNTESLEEVIDKVQSKFSEVFINGGTEGKSVILSGRIFTQVLYSLAPIPKEEDFTRVDGNFYSLDNMGCSIDITIQDKTIAYCSNLFIGASLELQNKRNHEKND